MHELPVRLKMISKFVSDAASDGSRLIDVGSDHGLLSVYCLKQGICSTAVLTDINEGPLMRSAQSIKDNCLEDRSLVQKEIDYAPT